MTACHAQGSPGHYRAKPSVISVRALESVVLMDGRTGQYLTLDGVAGRIWDLLGEGCTVETIVSHLADEYDVAEDQASVDANGLLAAWLRQGLIEPRLARVVLKPAQTTSRTINAAHNGQESTAKANLVVPSTLRCTLMLLGIKVMLRVRGFMQSAAWIRARVELIEATESATVQTVQAIEYSVAMAAALYPGRARCLEQSLVLYYLLRKQGVAAKYRQGVQPHPFQAHAWVEYLGKVINDVDEHAVQFTPLPDQLP